MGESLFLDRFNAPGNIFRSRRRRMEARGSSGDGKTRKTLKKSLLSVFLPLFFFKSGPLFSAILPPFLPSRARLASLVTCLLQLEVLSALDPSGTFSLLDWASISVGFASRGLWVARINRAFSRSLLIHEELGFLHQHHPEQSDCSSLSRCLQ